MDLREIGAMLREERERQGLSLDTVSDKIKISRSCLAAIEEGKESFLPHPVYAKGFIKNYAKILGIDQADFAKSLTELYQTEDPQFRESSLTAEIPGEECGSCLPSLAPRPPIRLLVMGAAALLLVVGIGWFLVAQVFSRSGDETPAKAIPAAAAPAELPPVRPQPSAVEVPAASDPAPTPVAPTPVAPAPVMPTPAPVPVVPVAEPVSPAAEALSRPEPTPEDRATQDIAVSGPAAPVPGVPAAPETAVPAVKTFTVGESGPHTVSIVANERCWLQAGADGGDMHETMLEKGDAFTGRFTDYLLVRLGNAGGVEIRFDNKLYPLQAGKGAVKTLKFVAKKTEGEAAKPAGPAATLPAALAAEPAVPAPATAPVPAAPAVSVGAAPAPGEGVPGAKEVEIYGQDGSWVIVSPDKGPSKEIYVKKGQRITVPFAEKIEIKLGNPSSVVFRHDGKETPVTTEKGASKTIRFP
ncbi:RodZ domain-containing protein [Solidesulfovibrio sp.]